MSEVADGFAEAWRHRGYLIDLAFRILGDVGGAEDVVQEAYARLARARDDIDDVRGWLTVITSRLCVDQIRSARVRRERITDAAEFEAAVPLAQPIPVDPADRITLDDEVRLALFVVLERLGPAERVAFVLHDVFQLPFDSIAGILGRPVPTCRQLARRARQKVLAAQPRSFDVAAAEHRAVTERFIEACANGDLDALVTVLDPQVWGAVEFATQTGRESVTVHGPEAVARNMLRYWGSHATLVSHPIGTNPKLLAFVDRRPAALITLTVRHGLVAKVHVTTEGDAIRRP
ncbi:RNA polymerase sigma factor SigI [Actinoallomurus sp. CA-150999]|uniref:RNA polymerase sigma factor SigI n=1 Tax=Actinoallomurus sp. CA-150999 TaxID=3239887 RepID=UPI003D947A01